jgi:hypothetical protein
LSAGGRIWWAHLAFSRMKTGPTIRRNQLEDLMNVKGIGEKSFLKLKPMLTISQKPESAGAPAK